MKLIYNEHRDTWNQWGIYIIINIHSGRMYIGYCSGFRKRWREHKSVMKHKRHSSYLMNRSINSRGDSACYVFEILQLVDAHSCEEKVLKFIEKYWIALYNSADSNVGYNILKCDDRSGVPRRPETIAKLKETTYFKTMPRDAQWIEQMLKTKRENNSLNLTEETKQKISKAHIGKKKSDAHKAAISKNQESRYRPVLQYTKDGIFIREFPSMLHCSKQLEIETGIREDKWQIWHCCTGRAITNYGFTFRYKENDNFPLKIEVHKGKRYTEESKKREKEGAARGRANRNKNKNLEI